MWGLCLETESGGESRVEILNCRLSDWLADNCQYMWLEQGEDEEKVLLEVKKEWAVNSRPNGASFPLTASKHCEWIRGVLTGP